MPGEVNPIFSAQAKALSAAEAQESTDHLLSAVNEFESMQDACDSGFARLLIRRNFRDVEKLKGAREELKETREREKTEEGVEQIGKTEETATRFQSKNPELEKKILILLRASIKEEDTPEEILKKVLEFYPDYTLADEAFDYLLETSGGKLREKIRIAKEYLNKAYQREIVAGRNIRLHANIFAEQGLGTPTHLRNLYREMTGNPKKPVEYFDELSSKYTFDELKGVIRFLLHALGTDMKAKGSSIDPGELYHLLIETRLLQAIFGVYLYFKSRMKVLQKQFSFYDLDAREIKAITFENLAKAFMKLFKEKYISSEKILQLAALLHIAGSTGAQIAVFTQMQEALRQVSPGLYSSSEQREDLTESFLEALEELEVQLEEEES